jgi:hypothetical protein
MMEIAQDLGGAERTPCEHRHHDQDECADDRCLGSQDSQASGDGGEGGTDLAVAVFVGDGERTEDPDSEDRVFASGDEGAGDRVEGSFG